MGKVLAIGIVFLVIAITIFVLGFIAGMAGTMPVPTTPPPTSAAAAFGVIGVL